MNSEQKASEEDVIDLAQLIQKLIREKLFVIGGAALGGIVGIIFYIANPMYLSVATLEVRKETDGIVADVPSGGILPSSVTDNAMQTLAEKFTTRNFMVRLAGRPDIVSCVNLIPKGRSGKEYFSGEESTEEERTDVFVGWVGSEKIAVQPKPNSDLLEILVKHPNARTASVIANTIYQMALEEAKAMKDLDTSLIIEGLNKNSRVRADVMNSVRSQLSLYDSAKSLKEGILEARSEISTLSGVFKSKHPTLKAAEAKLTQLNELLVKEVAKISSKETEREYWSFVPEFQKVPELTDSEIRLQAANVAEKLIPSLDVRLTSLERDLESMERTFDEVTTGTATAEAALNAALGSLTSFEPAYFEGTKAGLSPVILLVLGGILGTGLGVAIALLRALVLKKGVCNNIEWSQNFELPVIGELLQLEGGQLNPWQLAGTNSEDASHYRQAETVRSIRAHITLLGRTSKRKRLLVTSARPEEGKTTLSSSLALSFARLKTPTLLIDLDLRKPSVHQVLGLPNKKGITDLLLGETDLESAIQELEGGTLHVITAGQFVSDAPELLSTDKLDKLLSEISGSYEWVIFDSAPFLSVSDTKLIAPYADHSLLTVRANRTEVPAIESTLTELKDQGAEPVGAVINFVRSSDVKEAKASDGYGYGYGYGLSKCSTT